MAILLVEDDPDVRDALAEILADEGYEVAVAVDGAEALTAMRDRSPSLVLLDLTLPGMGGEAFRAAQREDPTLAAIPVVLLSGDGRIEQRARELAVAGALRKPIDVDALLSLVARLLRPVDPAPRAE